ncbi:MAG: dihydropteroate synthase [Pseudomonadota bacterium]
MKPAPFDPRVWRLAEGHSIVLGTEGVLMGILNATPDSFSDGGINDVPDMATDNAARMVAERASIIDIGAESTRPGAEEVDATTEVARLMPVFEAVHNRVAEKALISIDTYRATTAAAALKAGAHIINDVWGLQRDPELASVIAEYGAGAVLMHTSRNREALDDVVDDQKWFFDRSLSIASKAGIPDSSIVLDPGFGFGKDADTNFELMRRFNELHAFGFPLLAGTSRKRFIGAATVREAEDRDIGTAATTAILREKGAAVFRVHNVAINADALAIADAMVDVDTGKV